MRCRGTSLTDRRVLAPRLPWLALSLLAGCGSSSLVIGGDPERESLASDGAGTASTAGASATGGTAGTLNGAPSAGGALAPDPYPWVVWAQGSGYETSCPLDGDGRGFSCWSHTEAGTEPCEDDGTPYCSACSCRVSCDAASDCPPARNGQPADCLADGAERGSCFVVCGANGACPSGMTCSVHPGFGREVCVFWDADAPWNSTPK